MIKNNAQNKINLPRIIFLYDKHTNIPINEIKQAMNNLTFECLDGVIVDYYDENGEWFKNYFKKSEVSSLKNEFGKGQKLLEKSKDTKILNNERKTEEGLVQPMTDTVCGKGPEVPASSSMEYICPSCQKKFLKPNSLNQHIHDKNEIDENHGRLYRLHRFSELRKLLPKNTDSTSGIKKTP